MKLRTGFVSNSSSSSFAILGIEVDESKLKKISEQWMEHPTRNLDENLDYSIQKCGDNLSYVFNPDSGVCYIGAGFNGMLMTKTKAEFKQRIANNLSILTKESITINDIDWFVDSFWS